MKKYIFELIIGILLFICGVLITFASAIASTQDAFKGCCGVFMGIFLICVGGGYLFGIYRAIKNEEIELNKQKYLKSLKESIRCDLEEEIKLNKQLDFAINSPREIERVIFNRPATIVFWKDGTKTVVVRQKGDRYDKEKGLAMAIVKHLYGNKSKYNDIIKKFMDKD